MSYTLHIDNYTWDAKRSDTKVRLQLVGKRHTAKIYLSKMLKDSKLLAAIDPRNLCKLIQADATCRAMNRKLDDSSNDYWYA